MVLLAEVVFFRTIVADHPRDCQKCNKNSEDRILLCHTIRYALLGDGILRQWQFAGILAYISRKGYSGKLLNQILIPEH